MLDSVDLSCTSKKTKQSPDIGPTRRFDFESLQYICRNLREKAKQEAIASGWDGNADTLADLFYRAFNNDIAAVGGLENPIYAGGAIEVYPGAWQMWSVATEDFDKIMLSVTKYVRRIMLPKIVRHGAWRIEARCIGGDVETQKWMQLLGAKLESTQKGTGKNGEDFLIYVWSFPNVRR